MLGLYHTVRSPIHAAPAWLKLGGLGTVLAVMTWRSDTVTVAAGVVLTAGLYLGARIPLRLGWSQLRPACWLLLAAGGFQVVTAGLTAAALTTGQLAVAVALASLLSLTTRVGDLLDVLDRLLSPLQRVGVDTSQVSLLLALTIRCLPFVSTIVGEVRLAQQARGLPPDPARTMATATVRTLRAADRLAEALAVRGLAE